MTKLPKPKSLKWCESHPISIELLKFVKPKERVIDLGCGRGQRTFLVASDWCRNEVTGVDLNLEGIEYAVKNYQLPNLNFVFSDLNNLPFKNVFDSAFMLAVIEHVDNTDDILKGIKRVLKPNGRLFISVTNRGYHGDESDVHIFTEDSIRTVLDKYYTILKLYIHANNIFVECQCLRS